jgi:hypothetical protein
LHKELDLDWIIIFFVIYLDASSGKIGGISCRVILAAGPNLENLGQKIVLNLPEPF